MNLKQLDSYVEQPSREKWVKMPDVLTEPNCVASVRAAKWQGNKQINISHAVTWSMFTDQLGGNVFIAHHFSQQ